MTFWRSKLGLTSDSRTSWPLAIVMLLLCGLLIAGCVSAPARPATSKAVVTDFGSTPGATNDISREELQEEVMRFADRFSSGLNEVATQARYSEGRSQQRVDMLSFQYAVNAAPLNVALGPNAVTNLLDMMVMASLAHHAAVKFWAGDLHHPDDVAVLLKTTARMEEDIWGVSKKVLTAEQQDEMRRLIDAWIADHPDVRDVFGVRFSAFSGQRAASLREVQRTGGLMQDVSRSVDAIEDFQEYGERMLFYMQRFPDLARLQSEWATYEVLNQAEIQSIVEDMGRMVLVAERLSDQLPRERVAAIDQLMDRVAAEREQVFESVLGEQSQLRGTVAEFAELAVLVERITANLKETTVILERTSSAINLDLADDTKPVDIQGYEDLLRASGETAKNLRLLLTSTQSLGNRLPAAFNAVDDELDYLVNRIFILALALVLATFLALFIYRKAAQRYL
jgi:hypothetical protein